MVSYSRVRNRNELLLLAEFAYNNGYQETIKTTPFYANYGRNPKHQLINHMITEKETSAKDMENLHQTLQEEMTTAQLRQKENYDQHRKPDPNLKSGDMVCGFCHAMSRPQGHQRNWIRRKWGHSK